jgi:hypothetical protein
MTLRPTALAALLTLCSLAPGALEAQEHAHHSSPAGFEVPEPMRIEHEAIHARLVRATEVPGRVGEAARELARTLGPHFERENEIALPPLALLEPLAHGSTDLAMRAVLPMTDALRAELPQMLEEHREIAAAARHLEEVARAEGNAEVESLARTLQLHARSEEQVFYPAAVLVGDLVRARTGP